MSIEHGSNPEFSQFEELQTVFNDHFYNFDEFDAEIGDIPRRSEMVNFLTELQLLYPKLPKQGSLQPRLDDYALYNLMAGSTLPQGEVATALDLPEGVLERYIRTATIEDQKGVGQIGLEALRRLLPSEPDKA